MKLKAHPQLPTKIEVTDFGPVKHAELSFFRGLTVIVGPQATGKSVLLQLVKLLVDMPQIKKELVRAGVDWEGDFKRFLDVYFGEGMQSLWRGRTQIQFDRKDVDLPARVQDKRRGTLESMFYIPAQRVLALRDGWPSAFNYYDASIPFTLREFSEHLRLLMSDFGSEGTLFPVPRRLKAEFRKLLQSQIFPGYNLQIDTERAQRRLVLANTNGHGGRLPVSVWSAGQREFVPLLLGLYWLMLPTKAPRRTGLEWVVIEELEMGLHPRAIAVVMLMVFELMARGYRVCLSTHSPQVLDAVWAMQRLAANKASPAELLRVFNVDATQPMLDMAAKAMGRRVKVYYFDRKGNTRDISDLDSTAESEGNSGWGGLTEFSGRAADAVARAVANSQRNENRDAWRSR